MYEIIFFSELYTIKAISYVIWLNILLQLVNFVIEEFVLWNIALIFFPSNILCWLDQMLHM